MLPFRFISPTKSPEAVVDHVVIGGGVSCSLSMVATRRTEILVVWTKGVVGLAVARALSQRFPEKTTILIERHARAGEETRYEPTHRSTHLFRS
jgi:L-2-hydroxyglutarate oxidase LhgO